MRADVSLTVYRGPAGDHNDRAGQAVVDVGAALARRLGSDGVIVGEPAPARPAWWDVELDRARATLQAMAARIDEVMTGGQVPVTAMTRCAVALATQPVVVRHRPDTVVVWLDAHGDINTPGDTRTGFLGGMALSGPLGWWDSGLGAGVPADHAVLVGARDLDDAETAHVQAGRIALVPPGPGLGERLARVIAGRPVYLHIDCDVHEPGVVATDYAVPGGFTLDDLHTCATVVARSEVVGVEVAEFEGPGSATADDLVDALAPALGPRDP
ncbi:arginase family protein [Modestobacter sp. SYSU DS0290]